MGWNTGYTIFEHTVIGAYDLGKLDKELLAVLMEPYRGTDIDSGGAAFIESKDGLGVEEIVLKVMGVGLIEKPPQDTDEYDSYRDWVCDKFHKITRDFGWC